MIIGTQREDKFQMGYNNNSYDREKEEYTGEGGQRWFKRRKDELGL